MSEVQQYYVLAFNNVNAPLDVPMINRHKKVNSKQEITDVVTFYKDLPTATAEAERKNSSQKRFNFYPMVLTRPAN